MTSLRQQRLARFRDDIVTGKPDSDDNLFRVLYGLPPEIQIEVARYMTARFLPVYRVHHPSVRWPEVILLGVDQYFSATGPGLPDEPEASLGGDAAFYNCLYGLSDAWSYAKENNLPRVTPACCTILIWAVAARASNVWYADDPEAVQAWIDNDSEALIGRTTRHNVASQAVRKREWLIVADWLEEYGVGSHPDTEDAEREEVLVWWKDRECLL